MTLWHYTCEHGRAAIGERGLVMPMRLWNPAQAAELDDLAGLADLAWFTDLDRPVPSGLGLTRLTIRCDRTRHRYRVTDERAAVRWIESPARTRRLRRWLEAAPGALPMHWWIATEPVAVVLAPLSIVAYVRNT